MRRLGLIAAVLLLAACGGGGGKVGVTTAVGIIRDDWLLVDLDTGAITPRPSLDDLAANPAYRDRVMVFRRVRPGVAAIGSPNGQPWAQGDEAAATADPGTCFIAAFEVTRAQWRRIAGTTPWTAVVPAELAGSGDGTLPACGLSLDAVTAACAAWQPGPGRLAVPSEAQWEVAARAGTTTRFSWGDDTAEAVVGRYAVVRQTAGGVTGPQPVGLRLPNPLGLCDIHGNLWEWTSAATLRGGSWNDGLPQARSANRLELDPATPHALAGARLVFRPPG